MGTRTHIKPSTEEAATDMTITAVRDSKVYAARDIPPFTRVAVCTGRLYTDKEHTRVFGEDDVWGQWTVQKVPQRGSLHRFKIEQGYIVSPGLPTGDIDPLFHDISTYGCSPYFAPALVEQEPWCVQVVNAKKGRMEYWVGRRGAKAGQLLTLCYGDVGATLAFPTLYVLYGHNTRPVSVLELARFRTGLEPYSILTQYLGEKVFTPNGRVTKKVQEWAKHYDPMKEMTPINRKNLRGAGNMNHIHDVFYELTKPKNKKKGEQEGIHEGNREEQPKVRLGNKVAITKPNGTIQYVPIMPKHVHRVVNGGMQRRMQRRLRAIIANKCELFKSMNNQVNFHLHHIIPTLTTFAKLYGIRPRSNLASGPPDYVMLEFLYSLIQDPEYTITRLVNDGTYSETVEKVFKSYSKYGLGGLLNIFKTFSKPGRSDLFIQFRDMILQEQAVRNFLALSCARTLRTALTVPRVLSLGERLDLRMKQNGWTL
jgi:hypothetical protein